MHNQFLTKLISLLCYNSKINHLNNLKFSVNVYISVIYLRLKFQNILTFLKLFIDN